jgi:hypothetical protein
MKLSLFFFVCEKYQHFVKVNVWVVLCRTVTSVLAQFSIVTEHKVT